MASIDRVDPVILGHILVGHRDLHERIASVRTAFTGAGPVSSAAVAGVHRLLVALRDHLRRHFEQEEEGGYLEESLTRVPRLNGAVRSVLAEHPPLLAELDGLIQSLARPDIPQPSWEQAHRDFETFAQHLVAHERNENAVVQQGYNEDLGLTD